MGDLPLPQGTGTFLSALFDEHPSHFITAMHKVILKN